MAIKVEFGPEYQPTLAKMKRAGTEIMKGLQDLTENQAEKINKEARTIHRYKTRTSTLERSIQNDIKKLSASVFIDDGISEYGKYVHDGHHSWAPDRFLTEAKSAQPEEIDREANKVIDEILQRIFS